MKGGAAARVGLLVFLCLAGLYLGMKQVNERKAGGGGYKVWGLFKNAVGLVDKSRVQVAGIVVGNIDKRELDEKHPGLARITIEIQKGTKLYKDAALIKKSASLLGEFYIEIDPGTPGGKELEDGDQVRDVREPVGFEEITRSINETVPILQGILQDVRKMTTPDGGVVPGLLGDLRTEVNQISGKLKGVLDDARGIAGDVKDVTGRSREDIVVAIKNVKDITDNISRLTSNGGTVDKTAQGIQEEVDKLKKATDKLDHALGQVDEIVTGVNKGEGTAGKILKDPAIAENVESITTDLSQFIGGLTRLQTIVGLRSEYNYLANTLKTYLSIQLQPKPDKYYLIELIDDPRGFRRETITLTQSSNPLVPQTVSEKKTEISDKFRFTFQFAKRVDFLTLRFGVKESTGGVGSDFHFRRDKGEVSVDLFDFRANVYPRLKVLIAYNFFKYLYVVGGADDVLNTRATAGGGGGRDYFLGAMLRFNDEDLRNVLFVGGGALTSATKQ